MRGVLDWGGVVLLAASGALLALLEVLFVPIYAGSTPVPVMIVLAIVGNVVLPRLSRNLVPTLLGTALPFFAWLVVVVGFGVVARPEGDVILPGGDLQWVSYGVLLGGALAGTVTVIAAVPPRRR